MDPKTGAIAVFETEKDAKLAGYTVPLTKAMAKEFFGMNRKQRRKRARELGLGKKSKLRK